MLSAHKLHEAICRRKRKRGLNMFWKKKKPFGKLELGLEVKRCSECHKNDRLCMADGKPATFHRWVEEDLAILKIHPFMRKEDQENIVRRFREEGVIDNSATIKRLRNCFALIEYQDGSMGKVKPELLQFIDVCTVPPAAEGP